MDETTPGLSPDGPTINKLIEAEVRARIEPLDQQTLDNLLAMALVAGYGIQCIDDKWEQFVPSQAVPLLRYMETPPAGDKKNPNSTKKKLYSLQQKNDAEKALQRLPYLLATYVDILRKIVQEQRELRKQADVPAATETTTPTA